MSQNCLNLKAKYSELVKLQQELNLVVLENKDSKQGKRIEKQMRGILKEIEDVYLNLPVDEKILKIKEKLQNNQPLLRKELLFIYQIEPKQKLNNNQQKELKNIIQGRDIKKEVALLLNCSEDQVTTTEEEALKGNIIYHYGHLNLEKLKSAEGLKLPEIINGDLNLTSLKSAEGLKLPETINGGLYLLYLESAKGLKFPKIVEGDLDLGSLKSAEGLKLPETINGKLNLTSLKSAKGLKLPETINGSVYLFSLSDDERDKLRKARPDLRII